jgi:4-amino-4-deoxy-L-arabinose transferase-like glycosyltransferase
MIAFGLYRLRLRGDPFVHAGALLIAARHEDRAARAAKGAALALIFVLAAALRFHALDAPSLWYDELASDVFANEPLSRLWSRWMVRETNPPLYYSLLHFWIATFGDSALSLRSPSALAGACAPLLVYAIAARLGLREASWLAAVVTALSARQIVSSQEARPYIFAQCAALLAILGLIRCLDALRRPRSSPRRGALLADLTLYVGGCAAALYLHTTLFVLPLIANLTFLSLWRRGAEGAWRNLGLWLLANLAVVCLWAWWALIAAQQTRSADITWIPHQSIAQAVATSIGVLFPRLPSDLPRVLAVLSLPIAALGLARMSRRSATVLLLFGLGAPVVLFVVSMQVPVLTQRTLLWAQFAATLAVAAGLWRPDRPWRSLVTASAFTLLLVNSLGDAQTMRVAEPWRELAESMSANLREKDVVAFSDASIGLALEYYCRRLRCRFMPVQVDAQLTPWSLGLFRGRVIAPEAAGGLFSPGARVWSVEYSGATIGRLLLPFAEPSPFGGPRLSFPPYLKVETWTAR